jgi:UDP-N-acetylmuramate: L-alanyl-gamma-D-glutamyl-meso-diaminopimelate ligase
VKVHFIAIGGTGMGALAGLLKASGHDVRGSDRALYPPMSDQLAALEIPVFEGFAAANLDWGPELVVVGNVCSKDHVEVVAAQERGLELTSLPALLGSELLAGQHSVVIAGTHGKTTTSALVTYLLMAGARDPSAFIGGVPLNLGQGWRLGGGQVFVVEGDEYDSAFFDKGSKFLHYQPRTAVITSIELDHVDIFSSMDAVRASFHKFVELIPEDGLLICADDPEVAAIAEAAACPVQTYRVVPKSGNGGGNGGEPDGSATWEVCNIRHLDSGRTRFAVFHEGANTGDYESLLSGDHNLGNLAAAIAVAHSQDIAPGLIRRGVATFAGVKRRAEFRGLARGVYIIDDYGHHPTSISLTLQGLRWRFPGRRIIALYEPRSATSRRKTFQREFADAFAHADSVVVGELFSPDKIPLEERFDPARLALDLHSGGTQAAYIENVDEIVARMVETVRPGDVVAVFSSGAFGGLHGKLLAALGDAIVPAAPADMGRITALLSELDLDHEDLGPEDSECFLTLDNEKGMVGCIGLEVFGEEAVIRGLAVKPEDRGGGYGWMLADAAIARARHRGVRRLYLVTARASDFFAAKHGFRVVELSTVSPAVAESTTFTSDRNRDSVAMRLDL